MSTVHIAFEVEVDDNALAVYRQRYASGLDHNGAAELLAHEAVAAWDFESLIDGGKEPKVWSFATTPDEVTTVYDESNVVNKDGDECEACDAADSFLCQYHEGLAEGLAFASYMLANIEDAHTDLMWQLFRREKAKQG